MIPLFSLMFGKDVVIVSKEKESPPPTPVNMEPQAPLDLSVIRNRFGADLQGPNDFVEDMDNKRSVGSTADGSTMTKSSSSSSSSNDLSNPNDIIQQSHEIEIEIETTEPVLLLGINISQLSRSNQFALCAIGVFAFTLLYGYLQELISVHILDRKLGLFLASAQFAGYSAWAFVLRNYITEKKANLSASFKIKPNNRKVPFLTYFGLSILRAIDLGLTNLAMQFVNYPAKTLIKSSRVVFTMIFGVIIYRKQYRFMEYVMVALMVSGLAIFMHADANSSAIFDSRGVFMLITALACEGAVSNISEKLMSHYAVGQDEYIFRLYSIALVAITAAAAFQGDLTEGLRFMMQPGSYNEMETPIEERTWSVSSKWTVLILFATMGFFGASCSAAITKNFGALLMSITSTARKATTLFLSFALFDNECTMEHLVGIVLFIFSLVWKSASRALPGATGETHEKKRRKIITLIRGSTDLEMAIDTTTITSPVFSKADLDLVQEKVPFLSATNSDDSSSVDSKELRPY